MPKLTIFAARAALIHLAAGFTFGGLLLANKGVNLHPALWGLLPAHIETLLLGWMVQLALAVAFWILPRFGGQRGNVALAWAAVVGLNLGVILTGFGPALNLPLAVPAVGRALSAAALVAFVAHAWPRVKAPGA